MEKSKFLEGIKSISWYGKPTEDKKFSNYKMLIFVKNAIEYTNIEYLQKMHDVLTDEYDIINRNIMALDSSLVLYCYYIELSTIHSLVSDFIEFNKEIKSTEIQNLCIFYKSRIEREKLFMDSINKCDTIEQKNSSINTSREKVSEMVDDVIAGYSLTSENGKSTDPNTHFPMYGEIVEKLSKCKFVNKSPKYSPAIAIMLLNEVIDYFQDIIHYLNGKSDKEMWFENICDLPHFINHNFDICIRSYDDPITIDDKEIYPVGIEIYYDNDIVISMGYNYEGDEDNRYDIVISY